MKNESVNCSFDMQKYALSPNKETCSLLDDTDGDVARKEMPSIAITKVSEEPLNLSVKKLSPNKSVYQPEVSDISLPEYSLNISEIEQEMSLAVNMSEFCPERVKELDADLRELEDQALEDEIERLAVARAASGCRFIN